MLLLRQEFAAKRVIDCAGGIIAPGYIDIQINGAFGVDFSDPALTKDQVFMVSRSLLQHGVTSFCPTIVSSADHIYQHAIDTVRVCYDAVSQTLITRFLILRCCCWHYSDPSLLWFQ